MLPVQYQGLLRGLAMKDQYTSEDRKEIKLKMATIFVENIQMLSTELREMLLDDLVTAFENRLKVLKRVDITVTLEAAESVDYETVQA
jgi:hypothetical protein